MTPTQPSNPDDISFVGLLADAQKQVRESVIYRKFIDGTPLENDVPVWMAEFARKHLQSSLTAAEAKVAELTEKEKIARSECITKAVLLGSWSRQYQDLEDAHKALTNQKAWTQKAL